jgi:stage II sporulation protein D
VLKGANKMLFTAVQAGGIMRNAVIMIVIFAVMLVGSPFLWQQISANSSEYVKDPEKYRVLLTETGEIATLSREEYITGCIFAQIPVNYSEETLKCQGVIAHTYAYRIISDNEAESENGKVTEYDLTDDAGSCQPYFTEEKAREFYKSDYDVFLPAVKKAASYGAEHLITYNKSPIYAVYHSVSAGKTNSALYVWGKDYPYLQSADSPNDVNYKNFECKNEMTPDNIRVILLNYDRGITMPVDYTKWFDILSKTNEGYVKSVKIGSAIRNGGDLWRLLNLRSTAFSVTYDGTNFVFTTKGYGHGVGLSQYGAETMAKSGGNCKDILEYYFKGTKVQ